MNADSQHVLNVSHEQTCSPECDPDNGIHVLSVPPQEVREHIPDPTVKVGLPTNLLSALGNTHVNLCFEVGNLVKLLDSVGWPENGPKESFDLKLDVPLSSALDFARENARLVWLILDLTSTLKWSLGEMVWGEDKIGHPILHSMGDPCRCPDHVIG